MDKKFWANTALCVFIGGCVVCAVTNVSSALTPKGLFRHDPQPCGKVADVVDKMLLRDSVLNDPSHEVTAKFEVTNNSDKDVENILVQCDFFDRSAANDQREPNFLDREQWLLGGVVKSGETKEYPPIKEKHFIHTNAVNHECVVADLDIFAPPLFALHSGDGGHATEHGESHDGGHEAGAEHGGEEAHH